MSTSPITIETTVHTSLEKAWDCWTSPSHITEWNFASDDWHCPQAINDLRVGGKFSFTMASRDGKMSFDFEGIYDEVIEHKKISYSLADGRKVEVIFENTDEGISVIESFDPENVHSLEMQREGWQAILDNYKRHTENSSS